jgi:hypothetical protein
VGPGLAVLFALTVRFLSRTVTPPLSPGSVAVPSALVAAGLALAYLLPGLYVWGSDNGFLGPLSKPHLAENLEKMPPDLKSLAGLLSQDPDVSKGRILCSEQVASFLTPYDRVYRFVQTRPLYTPWMLANAGRPTEGLERHRLACVLEDGKLPDAPTRNEWAEWRNLLGEETFRLVYGIGQSAKKPADLRTLLRRFQVTYIVTGPGEKAAKEFEGYGYRVIGRQGEFTLWRADGELGKTP